MKARSARETVAAADAFLGTVDQVLYAAEMERYARIVDDILHHPGLRGTSRSWSRGDDSAGARVGVGFATLNGDGCDGRRLNETCFPDLYGPSPAPYDPEQTVILRPDGDGVIAVRSVRDVAGGCR